MYRLISLILASTLLFFSCEKEKAVSDSLFDNRTYTGTFQRQVAGNGIFSNVSITFNNNNWSGQSQFQKYPALCKGTYTINGTNQITFDNTCAWTAEFDWTLILSGTYFFTINGDSLVISKDYNGNARDVYSLSRQ